MIPKTLILFVLLTIRDSFEDVPTLINLSTENQTLYDNILCRSCGVDISSSSYIFSKSSPASQYTIQDTLFRKEGVFVQVLLTEIFLQFPIITTSHSTCLGIGEWEESYSWFPGYRWKSCVCPECGSYIGWVFESVNADLSQPHSVFFGLILPNLIGESFLDSLTQNSGNLVD